MFERLLAGHRLGVMGAKWIGCTSLDPGDRGQIARVASKYVVSEGIQPEDAWLTALMQWMIGMPFPENKRRIAIALNYFLEQCEGRIPLSAATIIGARLVADEVLGEGTPDVDDELEPTERLTFDTREELDVFVRSVRRQNDMSDLDAAFRDHAAGRLSGPELEDALREIANRTLK